MSCNAVCNYALRDLRLVRLPGSMFCVDVSSSCCEQLVGGYCCFGFSSISDGLLSIAPCDCCE